MAERRMFANTITDSDVFLDMPASAQNLYFHLGMKADDDGVVNNPKTIMRVVRATEDDFNILALKKFILPLDKGIIVIKHWKINNYIQSDRYHKSKYKELLKNLTLDENNAYKIPNSNENVNTFIDDVYKMDTEVRLGKSKVSNNNIVGIEKISPTDLAKDIIEYLNRNAKKKFRANSDKSLYHIKARINEGYVLDDFKKVIDIKCAEWLGTIQEKYLRPETLFGSKFESYFNQKPEIKKTNGKQDIKHPEWVDDYVEDLKKGF